MDEMLPPFQRFYDEHRDVVWRFCRSAVGAAEADDCFQETFLAALRAYPRLDHADNLRGWVLRIAHRKTLDAHRARGRRPVPVPALAGEGQPGPEPPTDVWDRVRELPQKQRDAVLYRYAGDLPYREVGRMVGCSEAAARQNVREGLKKLREVLR